MLDKIRYYIQPNLTILDSKKILYNFSKNYRFGNPYMIASRNELLDLKINFSFEDLKIFPIKF